MPEQIAVPVLFLSEPIVLPGMVVPVELDDAARAAVDAAQASESGKLPSSSVIRAYSPSGASSTDSAVSPSSMGIISNPRAVK